MCQYMYLVMLEVDKQERKWQGNLLTNEKQIFSYRCAIEIYFDNIISIKAFVNVEFCYLTYHFFILKTCSPSVDAKTNSAEAEPREPEPTAPPPPKELTWADENTDVHHLTVETFDKFLSSHNSVLVMFYAPCKCVYACARCQ